MPTRAFLEIHEVILHNIILLSIFPDKMCSRHVLTFLYPGKQIITMITMMSKT